MLTTEMVEQAKCKLKQIALNDDYLFYITKEEAKKHNVKEGQMLAGGRVVYCRGTNAKHKRPKYS